jgi:hypothetical protein
MAAVPYVEFSNFTIAVGDGGGPETFTARCTMNLERGFTINPSYTDQEIPDCADDSLPSSIFRALSSVSAEISGSGVLDEQDAAFFADWLLAGSSKNVRVIVWSTSSVGSQFDFAAKVGSFNVTSSKNNVVNADLSLLSTGAITRTNLA